MTVRVLRMMAVSGLLLAGLAGCGILDFGDRDNNDGGDEPQGWEEQAAGIEGIISYRDQPSLLEPGHTEQPVTYQMDPPVGGMHHPIWQNCNGDVYTAPIRNEHAVHSLEHGAVWITYQPDLPADQVAALAERVTGTEKMLMSPYPGLDAPISLQAWGYQLKVDDAGDERIDAFIQALRVNASIEGPTVRCDSGISAPA